MDPMFSLLDNNNTRSVKFILSESSLYLVWGGFPQGSKIVGDCFQGSSNDAKDHVDMEDRFHFVALVFQYYFKRQMIFTFELSTALALSYC
jgi:hypothetical protein